MTSIVQHLVLPFAAQLTPIQERGKTIGIVLSGMLLGALLARTVSGFVGAALGWRAMYWIASMSMLVVAACVWFVFPESAPAEAISYRELLRSLVRIARKEPQLREASVVGALLFGALNAFWVNLVFFLETPPYHYGERAAGLFGLIGATSAVSVAIMGRLIDRRGTRFGLSLGLTTSLAAFLILWLFGRDLWALIAGVILLDAGVQVGQVSNQTRIYSLVPEAPSRANTIYMTAFFAGGALGAASGAYGWEGMQWDGVCIVGITMLAIALATHLSSNERAVPRLRYIPAK
jgi:predicted MFS family arabinose efflux permease